MNKKNKLILIILSVLFVLLVIFLVTKIISSDKGTIQINDVNEIFDDARK